METKIVVPELGESVIEATVAHWFKKEGDTVNVGEALVELETDKVNLEVGAKSPGVLSSIQAPEGKDVKVGDVLGLIDEKAAEPAAAAAEVKAPPEPARPNPAPVEQPPRAEESPRSNGHGSRESGLPQVSPVAYRLAQENDVDIHEVTGSGPEGRISKADVEHYLKQKQEPRAPEKEPASPPAPPPAQKPIVPPEPRVVETPAAPAGERPEERTRMSRRRRTIAQRLLEAKQGTAMLTTFNEVDMTAVMQLRRRHNEEFQARYGVKLGIVSFFVKAAIRALRAFPSLNGEIQGDEIVLKHYYDIGMAVGSAEGLVVPVIRDADRLSFAEIEKRVKDLVAKTEQGKLSIEDLRGGTFTITNGGVFGSLLSTPILNPPQVGILGLHKIEDRPVAVDGQVVVRPMMYLALSYDHRIVDGREAVQFLVNVKQGIEDPGLMLVEA
jgi:2-oxoglutarate dehydrogenase E2 component (dihydrolipoamide succinyltransferase)